MDLLSTRSRLFARLFLFATAHLDLVFGQAYQSVFTLDAFSLQQSCVQNCFTGGFELCYTDILGSVIGCPNKPCSKTFAAVDDCYCRGDLQLAANEWLSSCIDELCTIGDNGVNLANAASIYSGYCNDRGFTALPAQNSASTTATHSTSTSAQTTRNLNTSTAPPDQSETTPNNDSSNNNNKTLEIALAVVGGIAGLAIIIAAIFFRKIRQKRRHQNPMDLATYPNSYEYMSTQQLRPSDLHRLSDSAETVRPGDSYSVANMPTNSRPFRPPHPAPPSLVSTARPLR